MAEDQDLERDESRFIKAASANVLGNSVKILVEGGIGLWFGSVALLADAAHSIADLMGSVVVLIWGRIALHEADESHPHGHQRIEPMTALFVGATIVVLALLLLRESITGLIQGVEISFSFVLIFAVLFAVIDMAVVYWYTEHQNRELGSPALAALARDCLNDIYTSLAVSIGIAGVLLGYPFLDPVAGGLVSVIVLYQGLDICRENIDYLVGSAPPVEKREEIREAALRHRDVLGIHDFKAHYVGHEIEVELHVEVKSGHTLEEAHDIETEVADLIRGVDGVGDVHVHLDPEGLGEWKSG